MESGGAERIACPGGTISRRATAAADGRGDRISGATPAGTGPGSQRRSGSRRQPDWIGYVFILPSAAVFVAFQFVPIAYSVYLSLWNWNLLSPAKRFVGFANYRVLLSAGEFREAFVNTALFSMGSVGASVTIALLLAVALNRRTALHTAVQGAIFAPYVVSLVSVALVWLWILDPEYGLLNAGLRVAGIGPLPWLTHPSTALLSLVIVNVWKITGFNMMVFLAGLQVIPRELYEAASLDGAGAARTFWRVTVPLVSPMTFLLLIVDVVGTFQVFDIVNIMTQGGPVNSTNVLVYYVYQNLFQFFNVGRGSAAAVVLLGVVMALTGAQFAALRHRVHYLEG